MNKDEKKQVIDQLTVQLQENPIFYLTDTSELTVEVTNKLRRSCFEKGVSMTVVKNTLLQKAMENVEGKDFSEFYDTLKGATSLMFSDTGNVPAKVIKEFRKTSDKPILKGAYVEEAIFIGDDKLSILENIKSKEELIGDVIALLQSPAKNVISALKSGGSTIAGLVKTLQEK
jgi:large subunit ribosomal protein L10